MNTTIPLDLIERFLDVRDRIMLDQALDTGLDGPLASLNPLDQRILKELARSGRQTVGDLNKRFDLHPSTLSSALRRLEGQGWLRREINPANLRTHWVVLRPEGMKSLTAQRRAEEALAERLLSRLGGKAEQEQFLRLLETTLISDDE